MNLTPKRALLVCAVSTPEQAKDDKESLPAQERELTAIAEREGWDIVDVVRIPGFSRSYFTLRELAEAAAQEQEYGPKRLEDHINAADFDVMAVRSTNRFNREQSLNAEVIGKTIKLCKAEIYSVMDGWINRQNRRAMTAITGFRDSSEIDELVKRRAIGIQGRLKKGLPISGSGLFAYRVVRDPETGKALRSEVREELTPLLNDLAALLLEQVPFDHLERELFQRWGYVAANGKPYGVHIMYKMLYSPFSWGHNFYRVKGVARGRIAGLWAFDESVSPPEGYIIARNTHPPIYNGEQAEAVKAELRRRLEVSNRSSLRIGNKRFAGLVVCDECHWRYSYAYVTNRYGKTYFYMVCRNGVAERFNHTRCSNHKRMPEKIIFDFLNGHIEASLDRGLVSFDQRAVPSSARKDAERLRAAVDRLQRRLDNLIEELANADDDLKPDYRRKIRQTKDELQRAVDQAQTAEAQLHVRETAERRHESALARIQALGLPAFWEQDAAFVNRTLRDYMTGYRIVASERTILGFAPIEEINQSRRQKL